MLQSLRESYLESKERLKMKRGVKLPGGDNGVRMCRASAQKTPAFAYRKQTTPTTSTKPASACNDNNNNNNNEKAIY